MGKPLTALNGPETGLHPKQEVAALVLAKGGSLKDAAKQAGAGERTVKTWLADVPAFARRVGELRADMTARALGRLADATASAADTLRFLARKGKSESVRLMAARAVLELNHKLSQVPEIEAEIAALEAAQPEGNRR